MAIEIDPKALVMTALQSKNHNFRFREGKVKGTIEVSLTPQLKGQLIIVRHLVAGLNFPEWLKFDPNDETVCWETDEKDYNYQLVFTD
ncbi:MAG: hypothetical protein IJH39_10810 [Clostridia bacterium]|nr:hypothetical protein [Clostridia bacterium]